MYLSTLQWFAAANLALLLATVFIMVKRKSRSLFPWFFTFIAFSLVTIPLELVLGPRINSTAYFFLYWIIASLATLLAFAIMHEVFVHILKPYSALVDLGRLLFKWAIAFLALVSVITAFATNASDVGKICTAIQLTQRSSQLMLCGFLFLFVLFESRLGLSWRSPAVCIMLGFGTSAALALARYFAEEHFPNWAYSLDLVGAFASVAISAGWLAALALPQPARRTIQDSPTRLILQRWNEALMASPLMGRKAEVIAMSPIESFLPGVERTVERVMARKMMH